MHVLGMFLVIPLINACDFNLSGACCIVYIGYPSDLSEFGNVNLSLQKSRPTVIHSWRQRRVNTTRLSIGFIAAYRRRMNTTSVAYRFHSSSYIGLGLLLFASATFTCPSRPSPSLCLAGCVPVHSAYSYKH